MFEPENDIERALIRATTEASARPAFLRALMDAQVFVVLTAEGGAIVPGPNGTAAVQEGTRLTLATAQRGNETLLAFFTAASRATAWFKADHIISPERTRGLFERFPDLAAVLNPGSDYGKEFTRPEIAGLLAGDFEEPQQTQVLTDPQQVLLGHPKERPDALIAALARELGAVRSVTGAWLMLAHRAGEADQSWMLGVDHNGSWDDVHVAIGRAVAGDVLQRRMLDATPLAGNSLASTLRTGMPVIPEKRGLISKLLR